VVWVSATPGEGMPINKIRKKRQNKIFFIIEHLSLSKKKKFSGILRKTAQKWNIPFSLWNSMQQLIILPSDNHCSIRYRFFSQDKRTKRTALSPSPIANGKTLKNFQFSGHEASF
jgi:hypothetical protein